MVEGFKGRKHVVGGTWKRIKDMDELEAVDQ